MNPAKLAACALFSLALSACSTTLDRTFQYSGTDAKVLIGERGREFFVTFHDTDSTILIRRGVAGMLSQFDIEPLPYWRTAADTVLSQIGCTTVEVYSLSADPGTLWEARYSCPPETAVHAAVAERAPQWRAGIQAPDPLVRR